MPEQPPRAEPGAEALVRAAGGVLWRPADSGVEVAVVHRPKYDDWSLPKGKLDKGEVAVAGAVREVREETGFDAVVGRTLGSIRYQVVQGGRERPKLVQWWAMRTAGGRFVPGREIDRLRWLSPDDAIALLTRARDAEPLQRFVAGPASTRTLLLVRHGSAGSREEWDGDDADRPLDDVGRAQADAVAAVLPLYGTTRLVSAPLERCTATLEPLAARLGAVVEQDSALSASGWSADPERTVQRLRELVLDGAPAAVCSQGEVLPEVVPVLAGQCIAAGVRLEAEKGSLWALSFDDDGRPLDADYTEDLLG